MKIGSVMVVAERAARQEWWQVIAAVVAVIAVLWTVEMWRTE